MKYEYIVYELTEIPDAASHRQYARREAIASGVMPTLEDAQNAADVWFLKNPERIEVEVLGGSFNRRKTPISKRWVLMPIPR